MERFVRGRSVIPRGEDTRDESSKMFRGKISTSTGADVAHPGNRSQGILGAQHLCAVHHGQKPCPYIQVRQNGSPLGPRQPLVYSRGDPGKKDKNVLEGFSNRDPRTWTQKPAVRCTVTNMDRRRGNIIHAATFQLFPEFPSLNPIFLFFFFF